MTYKKLAMYMAQAVDKLERANVEDRFKGEYLVMLVRELIEADMLTALCFERRSEITAKERERARLI